MIAGKIIEQQSIATHFPSLWRFAIDSKQEEIVFVPYHIDQAQDEQGQDQYSPFTQASSTISVLHDKIQWIFGHTESLWQEKRIIGAMILFVLLNIMWLGTLTPVYAHSNSSHALPSEQHSQTKLIVNQKMPNPQQKSATTLPLMIEQPPPSTCSKRHVVANGETLSSIASTFTMDWNTIAQINHLDDPNSLAVGQILCIPLPNAQLSQQTFSSMTAVVGHTNLFAFPECTWWANERYHQLHGIYVPWTTDADAWQWIARAKDFGWHVTAQPSKGAIMTLQPHIQGAFDLGHVGIVENVLPNGHVIASNTNWGQYPTTVTDVEFTPGPGVSFITVSSSQ